MLRRLGLSPGWAKRIGPSIARQLNGEMLESALVASHLFHYSPPNAERDTVPQPSVYNRILDKAADLLGGQRPLARYLEAPLPDVYAWMRPGAEPPPTPVFLKAVDLVLEDLEIPEAQRAQKLRIAAIHEDRRRAAVMGRLNELIPANAGSGER
jgi:hypothetical protein